MGNKDEERERQKQQEYRELLKMKQGLIEESELIPETGYEKPPELHGRAKFSNFIYHNKWYLIVGIFAAALLTFLIVQTVTREKNDLYVLVISTTRQSELGWRTSDLEAALEKYCPDFDGNGYVHVGINYIDISTESGVSDYSNAQSIKFTSEIFSGESQLFIADEGLWAALFDNETTASSNFFESFSDRLPEDVLYNGAGIRLNSTVLCNDARWNTCPDIINIFFRAEYVNVVGNEKRAAEQRERAQTVLRNILDGSVVNPAED